MDLGIKSLQEVSSDIAITIERRGGLYEPPRKTGAVQIDQINLLDIKSARNGV
ncbi:hypothetical protein [Brenneria rubrifaciens]|nr:hypothetical protein [Brenneria rubrifaciens]